MGMLSDVSKADELPQTLPPSSEDVDVFLVRESDKHRVLS